MKFALVLAVCIAVVQAAPFINAPGRGIPGSYIIVLKEGQSADSFQATFEDITRRTNGRGRKPTIYRRYQKFPGFAATLNDAALKEILASDLVEYVELDDIITIQSSQLNPPSWGLPRVSQHDRDLTQPYFYNSAAGNGVTAYVIDTGVLTTHVEFGGRATLVNFVPGSANTDENGHGTHVAGTIAGTNYGLAKLAKIVALKVLDASGSGTTSAVVAALDYVAQHGVPGKAVCNMSLGGNKAMAIDDAVQRVNNANIPIIAAAGSNNACNGSPSGSPFAYAVGASDQNDRVLASTAWGPCVKAFAPGAQITSAWIGSNTATRVLTGSSMACAHVSGVVALYQSFFPLNTAADNYNKLNSLGTLNKLTGTFNGAPNRLVYNNGP